MSVQGCDGARRVTGGIMGRLRGAAAAAVVGASLVTAACGGTGATPAAQPKPPKPIAKPSTTVAAATSATPAKQLTHVTIAVPSKTDGFTDIYVGKDEGIFAQHGIAVKIAVMAPPTAMAALQAGSIDFWAGAGSGAKAEETGQPVRVVFLTADAPGQVIVGAKGIRSLKDLRGRNVAVKAPLDTTSLVTQYLLNQSGLAPGSYNLVYARTTGAEIALVSSGKVAAANLEFGPGFQLQAKGFPVLASSVNVKSMGEGLVTSLNEVRNKPNLIRNTVAAEMAILKKMEADRAATVSVMERDFGDSAAIAAKVYSLSRKTWVLDGVPSAQVVRNEIRFDTRALRGAHVHLAHPLQESDFFDPAFVKGTSGT